MIISSAFSGCIIFHKVSYEVKLETPEKGTATVTAYDMRSDASNKKDFQEDTTNLFSYMLKSRQFVADQKTRDKLITSRKLFVKDGKLIGQGVFNFDNVSAVEGIRYEGGFHYLNLGLEDSVISTNGEIIKDQNYKRIMWDSTFKELKFTMFSHAFKDGEYKPLAPYYEKMKK